MIKHISDAAAGFQWVDIITFSPDELREVAREYRLPVGVVKDCLSPSHLPKAERIGEVVFIVTRYADTSSHEEAETIQSLTNKIAIFVTDTHVVSIHRAEASYLNILKSDWEKGKQYKYQSQEHLVNKIIDETLRTYVQILKSLEEKIDKYEQLMFDDKKTNTVIRRLYSLKRRASVFKRLLSHTKDLIRSYNKIAGDGDLYGHDLIGVAESIHEFADELSENISNLLNLQLGLASNRTNDIMNVLTLYSAFFMPMTFITGIYGMNFENMPELKTSYGYFVALMVMASVASGIFFWFKKKGWIR